VADADRLVAALRYQQELEDASRPATVNPLMARKAEAIKQNAPAENMLTQYAETMPQNWQQFGQNMAQAYPTPATGASREQILGAVKQAAVNAGPLMTVYHASPHKFAAFDANKIGTGQGAQSYGHGIYAAESPLVSGRGGQYDREFTAKVLGKYDLNQQEGMILSMMKDSPSDLETLMRMQKAGIADDFDQAHSALERVNKAKSNIYKVDLPDEHIAKMLDWDKPLSQQPYVMEKLKKNMFFKDADPNISGQQFMRDYLAGGDMSNPEATSALKTLGFTGIRYLDQGSRAGGAGTSNFVVFPGNEGLLKILERM
jgi:hypothetical protein